MFFRLWAGYLGRLWELDEGRGSSQSLGMTEYQIDWPLLGTILSGTIPITIAAGKGFHFGACALRGKQEIAQVADDVFSHRFIAHR